MQKRTDIRKAKTDTANGGNYWEEAYAYELEADAPMTDADIEAFFGGWIFPIVKHKVNIAPDGLSARVALVFDNCD